MIWQFEMFEPLKQVFALDLYDAGAVQFGAFKLKLHETHPDAPLSPIYMNLRDTENPKPGPLMPIHYRVAAMLMQHITAAKADFNAVCGLPNAGEPFADAFMQVLEVYGKRNVIRVYLQKDTAEDGSRKIVGLAPGQSPESVAGLRVLVIDDLITQANTKIEGFEALQGVGCQIAGLLVLIDRNQGGSELLLDRTGIYTYSVYDLNWLVEFYFDYHLLDEDKRGEVNEYLLANRVVS